MAVYKVPQDVEAEDKLIGPFSFRQFIYLIIVALAGAMAWGLYQLFPLLVIIPVPIIIFFGALALPLRKDQPMEIYLAAMVSFFLKPHKRTWTADGIESLVEITAPKTIELQRIKNLSRGEAQERFGYLAEIVDSQGWAVRGQGVQAPNSAMNNDIYYAAQQVEDILDSNHTVAQSLDIMIGQSDEKRHQDMLDRMHQPPTTAPAPSAQPQPTVPSPDAAFTSQQQSAAGSTPLTDSLPLTFSPYPTDIQQSVIQPLGAATLSPNPIIPPVPQPTSAAQTPVQSTSDKLVSPGIINLASSTDLSIETIAREANRIKERENASEVIISLR